MNVFIAGIDGYLGWSLALYLTERGHKVGGADLFLRRDWVAEMESQSATPIKDMDGRQIAYSEHFGQDLWFKKGDFRDFDFVLECFREFKPDAIVHLGENPSAGFSMIDVHHCNFTQINNLIGTLNILYAMKEVCPHAHLVKLGTMGEYGTPNVDIPEGFFTIEYKGRKDTLPFPRQAGSWYHWTKVHDSNNIMFACKMWGIQSTDIMQGVVFGTRIDEMGDDERLLTRFDFDQCFGTVVNRYCAEAVIGHPLTPFGKGHQKRGFLPLRDSMQCLTIAVENPPDNGDYRVFNQFEEIYDVTDLALKVSKVGNELGLDVKVRNLENPRKEMEEHYYNPDHEHLFNLGYNPTHDVEEELRIMLKDLMKYKDNILEKKDVLIPDIRWDGTRNKVGYLLNKQEFAERTFVLK
jgi:UDP-sulfoquinovose synthase